MSLSTLFKNAWSDTDISRTLVPLEIFDLQIEAPVVDCGSTHSQLRVLGKDTDTVIRGQELDYQCQIGKCFLLLTNLNSGYDASIEITLLDSRYTLVSHRTLDQLSSSIRLLEVEAVDRNCCDILLSDGSIYRIFVRHRISTILLPFLPRLRVIRR